MTSTATPRANHAAASAMSNYANENYHASYLEIYAKPKVSSYSGSSSSSVYPPRHWSTTSTTSASTSSSSSSSTSTGSSTSYHPSEALKPAHGPHASRPATTNARASDYIPRPSQPLSKPTSASKSYAAGNNSTSKISPLSAAKRIPHSPPALYPARVWTPTAADRLGCVGAPWASSRKSSLSQFSRDWN